MRFLRRIPPEGWLINIVDYLLHLTLAFLDFHVQDILSLPRDRPAAGWSFQFAVWVVISERKLGVWLIAVIIRWPVSLRAFASRFVELENFICFLEYLSRARAQLDLIDLFVHTLLAQEGVRLSDEVFDETLHFLRFWCHIHYNKQNIIINIQKTK